MTNLWLITVLLLQPLQQRYEAVVQRIIDGDTIKVVLNEKVVKVRLIGIDTPEDKLNKKAFQDSKKSGIDTEVIIEHGKKATQFIKTVIKKGDIIYLEYDVQRYDIYGRLLAYVYLQDGRMLNEILIAEGYANLMTIPPNIKYYDIFLKAYSKAREEKKGLWKE